MKLYIAIAIVATFLLCHAPASLVGQGTTTYKFDDPESAAKSAKWTDSQLKVTENGLGIEDNPGNGRGMFLLLQPIAIGHGWRPAASVNLSVTLNFENEKAMPQHYRYKTFVRWSPNGESWSTWQAMITRRPKTDKGKQERSDTGPRFLYRGHISVPRIETTAYDRKLMAYQKLDVPWIADEHALCVWITKEDPSFFAKNISFPGFVQVYVEGSIRSNHRLKSVVVNHDTSASSVRKHPPKDRTLMQKRDGVWKFWTVKKSDPKPACGFHSFFR